MYGNYNPTYYGNQNLQASIQSQIQQLQQLQAQQQQMTQPQQVLTNRGTFIQVSDYQEVVKFPTDASGMPTLFMNDKTGVFWVKKFIDGTNKIQAYSYAPINDFNNNMNNNEDNKEKSVKNDSNDVISNLQERQVSLEDKMDKILNMLGGNKNAKPNSTSKSIQESTSTNAK